MISRTRVRDTGSFKHSDVTIWGWSCSNIDDINSCLKQAINDIKGTSFWAKQGKDTLVSDTLVCMERMCLLLMACSRLLHTVGNQLMKGWKENSLPQPMWCLDSTNQNYLHYRWSTHSQSNMGSFFLAYVLYLSCSTWLFLAPQTITFLVLHVLDFVIPHMCTSCYDPFHQIFVPLSAPHTWARTKGAVPAIM